VIDSTYEITRKRGVPATIRQLSTTSADPLTGDRTDVTIDTVVRNVVVEPTPYSRVISAKEVQQDVGATTVIFWAKDIPAITRLRQEDRIIVSAAEYNVVSSVLEETALVVTVNRVKV
jgi:hypothetical protein